MGNSSLLSQQVEQIIKKNIITGALKAGQKISIVELRNQMSISSTPIRDAVKALEIKGFLAISPRESIMVARMTREKLKEIFEVRIGLECMAVELSTQKIPLEKLDQAIKLTRSASVSFENTHDLVHLKNVNSLVHDLIMEYSNNQKLISWIRETQDQVDWAQTIIVNPKNVLEFSVPEHLHILNAIRRRDVIDGQEAMRIHLNNAFRRTMETL